MRFFYLEEVNLIPAMCLCLKAISRNVFHLQASLKWANAQLISKHIEGNFLHKDILKHPIR